MAGLIDFWGGQGGIVTGGLGNIPSSTVPVPAPSNGAEQQEAVDILTTNFNPTFVGLNWEALLEAIAVGDAINFANAQYAFDQLFMSTASSPYLVTLASDYGVEYPTNVGMPDSLFSEYAISSYVDQLTLNALQEIEEVFYGDIATRASVTSANPEPYNISGGMSLNLFFDGQQNIPVNFQNTDFLSNGTALAAEVAFAITRACILNNSNAFAVAQYNPLTGKNYVTIFSGALGFAGSVQVTGGQAQDWLVFPKQLTNLTNNEGGLGTVWNITKSALVGGNARYTFAGTLGSANDPEIWQAHVGDYVNIFAPPGQTSAFNANNLGSFIITAIGVNFFEVTNPYVVPQSVTDSSNNPTYVNFYRPLKYTIQANYRWSAVGQVGTYNEINVTLPATSNVVLREPPYAAYLQIPETFTISSLVRDFNGFVEVTTSTPHGLSAGNQIIIDSVIPTPFAQQQFGPNYGTNYAAEGIATPNTVALKDGRVLVFGGYANVGNTCPSMAQVFWPQNRAVQSGLAATNLLTFAVQPSGTSVIVTLSQGGGSTAPIWNSIPFPGDTVNIPSTSVLAGSGLANRGWYTVTAATSTSITMTSLYTVGTLVNVTNASVGVTDNIDVYVANDPMTGASWSTMTALPSPYTSSNMYGGIAVCLNNGKVLVAGGYTGTTNYTTSRLNGACLYNPANDTWTTTNSMNSARGSNSTSFPMTYSLMADGTVLVIGGASATDSTSEYYEPTSGVWINSATIGGSNPPVVGAAFVSYPSGSQYLGSISGGQDHLGNALNTIYFYGYVDGVNTWVKETFGNSNTVQLTEPRYGHTATTFVDKRVSAKFGSNNTSVGVLFFGGYTTGAVLTDNAEVLLGVSNGAFTSPFQVSVPVVSLYAGNTAISLNNGDILIGGIGFSSVASAISPLSFPFLFPVMFGGSLIESFLYANQIVFHPDKLNFTVVDSLLFPRNYSSCAKLLDGSVLYTGSTQAGSFSSQFSEDFSPNVSGGGLNNIFSIQAIQSPTQFSISTPSKLYRSKASLGNVTWMGAPYELDAPGPYVYDTAIPFTVNNNDLLINSKFTKSSAPLTNVFTTVLQQLNQGQNYGIIEVANAIAFPDASGYLVFNFGNDNQVINVPYLGRPSSGTLQLDYRFVFPQTVPINADVTLSVSPTLGAPTVLGPWVPPNVYELNTFYVTDSPAGRAAAQAAIADAAAGGVLVNNIVVYPGSYGLGNGQQPVIGVPKINDIVGIYAENVDAEIAAAREGE